MAFGYANKTTPCHRQNRHSVNKQIQSSGLPNANLIIIGDFFKPCEPNAPKSTPTAIMTLAIAPRRIPFFWVFVSRLPKTDLVVIVVQNHAIYGNGRLDFIHCIFFNLTDTLGRNIILGGQIVQSGFVIIKPAFGDNVS